MKNFLTAAAFVLISASSCTTAKTSHTEDSAATAKYIDSGNFMFMAERANPTNYDVINVMNSMPNSTGTRMLSLDYGYGAHFSAEELVVELPYFGRMYNPSYDSSKNSLRFTSKDFSVNKTQNKKGNWNLEIHPKDVSNIRVMNLEIYKNRKAFLSVDANDRQPITFSGYITKNEVAK